MLASIAASVVLFCGINANWLSVSSSFLYMWWLILLMRSFYSTFPPKLSRLIGRYLDGSVLFSLPGFVSGIIFVVFHLLGKHPLYRHWLYIAVTSLRNLLNVRRKIPLVIPSIPGPFLPLKLSIVCFIYPWVNSVSSQVWIDSSVIFLIFYVSWLLILLCRL